MIWSNSQDFRTQSSPAAAVQFLLASCHQYLEAGWLFSSFCCSPRCFLEEDTLSPAVRWSR